jgi:hypothetical protein
MHSLVHNRGTVFADRPTCAAGIEDLPIRQIRAFASMSASAASD